MRRPTALLAVVRLAVLAAALPLAAASAAAQPAVRFTDDVLEITPALVAALVAGLDAEVAARPAVEREHAAAMARYEAASDAFPARLAEYERDVAAWQREVASYRACVAPIEDRLANGAETAADRAAAVRTGQRLEDPAFRAPMEARMRDLAARMQAAQARGDQRAMMALGDSLRAAMAPMTAAGHEGAAMAQRGQARAEAGLAEIRTRCGDDPATRRPRSPDSPNSLLPAGAHERIEAAGARAARLTPRQYAVLKERVGAYLALRKNGPGIAAQYAWAPGERLALDSAGPALVGHQTLLADW